MVVLNPPPPVIGAFLAALSQPVREQFLADRSAQALLEQAFAHARRHHAEIRAPFTGFGASLAARVGPDALATLRDLSVDDLFVAWACGQGDSAGARWLDSALDAELDWAVPAE